jgi:hypothetical protein
VGGWGVWGSPHELNMCARSVCVDYGDVEDIVVFHLFQYIGDTHAFTEEPITCGNVRCMMCDV